jgi:putative DNA primase/helicase
MQKPNVMPVLFEDIPMALKMIPRWVMWDYVEIVDNDGKKWKKLPVQADGRAAKSNDPKTWTDFLSAQNAYQSGRFDGVGFVFDGSDMLVGVDLDDCVDPATGDFTSPEAESIARKVGGYMEISPSGTGVKIFTRAELAYAHVDHERGLEVYPKGRYFTVTGRKVSGEIPTEPQDLSEIVPERTVKRSGDDFADYRTPVEGYDLHRVEGEILPHFDPSCGYSEWITVGMALHHQFNGDVEALELWDRWSDSDGKCGSYSPGLCDRKWETFSKSGGATLRSLIFKVNQAKKQEALERGEIILDPAPMSHARQFLESLYQTEEGCKLVHYADDWYVYKGTHYEQIDESTIRSAVYKFLDQCQKTDRRGNVIPFAPTPPTVSAAMDATKAIVHLRNAPNTKPPVWLENYQNGRPEAGKLISLENGLFHLEEGVLLPHSLGFFTQNSLPFSYTPEASCPVWESFLRQLWEGDQDSIDCLQEIFGYILSGDTRQQKFFNLIGPRRSGKGTINKVLVALLGQHNTVAPELGELCDTFGLQPWLGKLLASFTDARAPDRNRNAVVSQLLRIVGGDTVTVNRKNKESWNGYLPTRIVIYSNEVLQLTENSNALTGRMVVLRMTRSFYGKEDTDLATKLMKELSGIFNWAMVGEHRRVARGGHFLQPGSGLELLEVMEELSNPMKPFVEDVLLFEPGGVVDKDELFAVYKHWAHKKGIHPGNDLSFKKKFLAAVQDQPIENREIRSGGERRRVYVGIRLTDKAQQYVNTLGDLREDIF